MGLLILGVFALIGLWLAGLLNSGPKIDTHAGEDKSAAKPDEASTAAQQSQKSGTNTGFDAAREEERPEPACSARAPEPDPDVSLRKRLDVPAAHAPLTARPLPVDERPFESAHNYYAPKDARAIQNAVASRKIEQIFHFTRADNIRNILKYGLLSRNKVERRRIYSHYNDYARYDNILDGISLSISWPNYKMFYALRKRHPEYRWVIIEISSRILYEKECIFNKTNAANKVCSEMDRSERQGIKAFNNLFSDSLSKFPHDPQAEVLCLNDIGIPDFTKFYVNDKGSLETVEKCSPCIPVEYNDYFFGPRFDYGEW